MPRFPTWTWLPVRFAENAPVAPAAPSRPCIPSVEKLDPRVLFDAAAVDITPITIEKHIDQSTPLLAVAEADIFSKLGDIKGESLDDKHKDSIAQLEQGVLKLNWTLMKYHEDILSLKATVGEGADVGQKINKIFVKLESLAADIDGGIPNLLPAVQNLESKVVSTGEGNFGPGLLTDLSNLAAGDISSIPADARSVFIKLNDEFWKLDEIALDSRFDVLRGVPLDVAQKIADSKVKQEYLKIKLDEVLVSSYLTEQDKTDLASSVDVINGLIHGSDNPGGPILEVAFTGGVTVPGSGGDTIS
jgi:type VI protein secretion system component Hcp